MAKRHERTLARRSALQVLYQSEILGIPADTVIETGQVPEEAVTNGYARTLVLGVAGHKSELDRLIGASSQNWAIDRMPVIDRSVLRLAIYEMRYVKDVPASVTINEAVELAKEFGGEDDSHRFVNGVLGRLARESAEDAAEDTAGEKAALEQAAVEAEVEIEGEVAGFDAAPAAEAEEAAVAEGAEPVLAVEGAAEAQDQAPAAESAE